MTPLVSRRQACFYLGGLCAAGRAAAADAGFRFAGLDHIEFTVSAVEPSRDFYARVFGATVMKNRQTTRRYVKLGASYLAVDKSPNIRVDHYCAGVEAFDISAVHAALQKAGLAYRDFPSGKDLAVTDPDGIRAQLATADGWDQLSKGTAAAESVSAAEPIFRPIRIDHILLNVPDPEASTPFYERVFGPVLRRNNGRTWFQVGNARVGLLKTPQGERAGVNHFCVAAEPFDYDAAVQQLKAAGARVETPELAGAPEFRDPDGFLVQVTPSA